MYLSKICECGWFLDDDLASRRDVLEACVYAVVTSSGLYDIIVCIQLEWQFAQVNISEVPQICILSLWKCICTGFMYSS